MITTLKPKWQFAVLAAFLYVTYPLVDAAYYMAEEGRGAYSPNADTIAIPVYSDAFGLLLFSPFYAFGIWLATRFYQGGLSLFAFDTKRLVWSSLWSLLIGGLIIMDLYDAACKAIRILPLEVASDLAWIYLLVCLRSSLAGTGDVGTVAARATENS